MTTSLNVLWSNSDLRKACLLSGLVTLLCNLAAMCFVTYELAKLGTFNSEYKKARAGGGNVYNKDRQLLDPDEVEHVKRIGEYEEITVSVLLLLLIVTVLSSLSVIRGAAHKSRKSMIAWLLTIAPVSVYASVLVTLDCVVYGMSTENVVELAVWIILTVAEMICFRGVLRYYRHLTSEPHSIAAGRRSSAVFTIAGDVFEEPVGIMAMAVFPPAYEEVIVEGTPTYTVMSDGRIVPDDTKPPDYTP